MSAATTSAASAVVLRFADTEADAAACYELMRQLRPHLATKQEFIVRWQRQVAAGYRLLAVWDGREPVALAGFRIQENLVHDRHLYVDDLVTDTDRRSTGHGRLLMDRLKAEGRALNCAKLILDTGLNNALAHRFYYRQGLLATSLRFNTVL